MNITKNLTKKEELENINENLENMLKNNITDEKELEKQKNYFYSYLKEESNENNDNLVNLILKNINKIKNNKNKIEIKKLKTNSSNYDILFDINKKIKAIEININNVYDNAITKIFEVYIEKFTNSLKTLEEIFKNKNLNIYKDENKKEIEK